MENPNGVGLSPDGRTLFVAETYTCKLYAFDVTGPGEIGGAAALTGAGAKFGIRPKDISWFD